jgi:hypothetical protein
MPGLSRFILWNLLSLAAPPLQPVKPVMGEFMGLNGHTVQFKPALYARVCRKVRDYHSFEWDMGPDTDFTPRFPKARNGVDWEQVYGSWKKAGFETDVCIMFNNTPPDSWKDLSRDARAYGLAFARAFGPSSARRTVTSAEIGNEPGKYDDGKYRALFEGLAGGLREGDPKLKILTCNMTAGKSGPYEKSVECVRGLEALYDALNIHTYSIAEGWPAWRRSYPEDPAVNFLKPVERLIAWRDQNARGKEVWITEFGWDASTQPPPAEGEASKWKGNVSDEKQAQYLVRSFLLFSAMDVARAYLYFFNDADRPSFHASSGVTRNFEPKPSFHAVAHLHRALGEYRFARIQEAKEGELCAYEYVHGSNPRRKVLALWSPTGSDRKCAVEIPIGRGRLLRAERMALASGEVPPVEVSVREGRASVTLEESPLFLWVEED